MIVAFIDCCSYRLLISLIAAFTEFHLANEAHKAGDAERVVADGLGCVVQGAGCRVQGAGCRV